MILRPMPPYFLVKVARKTRDTGGRIIVPDTIKFMAYNMQCGEIVGIGSIAATHFPEAKIGMTLIIHHFVESESEHEARTDHLVHQEEGYNYYVVTVTEHNGKMNETYGVWDGEKIIPNKDYVFLELPEKAKDNIDFANVDKELKVPMEVSSGGILMFKEWEESREEKESKQKTLKLEAQNLSKSGNHKQHIQQAIQSKEIEMEKISLEINKKKYLPFKVAYYHPSLLNHYPKGTVIGPEDDVYVLNIAAQTTLQFQGKEYIVAKSNYIGGIKPKGLTFDPK
jgi:co-chaperonin GroES (HSP10)